jgi:hypothetical protein
MRTRQGRGVQGSRCHSSGVVCRGRVAGIRRRGGGAGHGARVGVGEGVAAVVPNRRNGPWDDGCRWFEDHCSRLQKGRR